MPQQPESRISKSIPSRVQQLAVGVHPHHRVVVAVAVDDRPAGQSAAARTPSRTRNSASVKVCAASRRAASSSGKRLTSSSRNTATQLGSRPDHRQAGGDLRPQRVEDLPELAPGEVEHAEVVERPAAAEHSGGGSPRGARRPPAPRTAASRDLRLEEVGEGVRPEEDGGRAAGGPPRSRPGTSGRAKAGRRRSGWMPPSLFRHPGDRGALRHPVRQARERATPAGPTRGSSPMA